MTALIIVAMVALAVGVTAALSWLVNPYRHLTKEERDWIKRNTDGWPG